MFFYVPNGLFYPLFGSKTVPLCILSSRYLKVLHVIQKILSIKERLFMGKLTFLPSFLTKTTKSDQY